MEEKILIIDFGSQYTQLIARRIRELNVYCEIHPFNAFPKVDNKIKGIILSGSPYSVNDNDSPNFDFLKFSDIPILGICYGAQLIAKKFKCKISQSKSREYGRAKINFIKKSKILNNIKLDSIVWMSHGDSITDVSSDLEIISSTNDVNVAAYKVKKNKIYGLQFHPEVTHTVNGSKILKNFTFSICGCKGNWTSKKFINTSILEIKNKLKNDKVILGLSGGVDSSVAAFLINSAVGDNLVCVFVDNGLLRKNEYENVLRSYKNLGLNVIGVNAKNKFYSSLKGKSDPEEKRKAIGKTFIDIFEQESKKIKNTKWLAQGTIYPDIIESVSVKGPSATIKSHHNVGGLPKKMNLKIIEPLNTLFKDEVRKIGISLNIPKKILNRHPFPGPGLAIRILGEVTEKRISILQEADHIFISSLLKENLYNNIWQAGVVFLPIKSVGVMGDERTYENVVVLRAVNSLDGMTADWSKLSSDFLSKVSNEIINKVRGVNRVVFDISSKPPATIEWE